MIPILALIGSKLQKLDLQAIIKVILDIPSSECQNSAQRSHYVSEVWVSIGAAQQLDENFFAEGSLITCLTLVYEGQPTSLLLWASLPVWGQASLMLMERFFVCSSVWGMLRVKTTLPFAFTILALPRGRMSSLQSVTNNTPVLRVPAVRYEVRTGKGNPWISVSWGSPSLSIHVECRSELRFMRLWDTKASMIACDKCLWLDSVNSNLANIDCNCKSYEFLRSARLVISTITIHEHMHSATQQRHRESQVR